MSISKLGRVGVVGAVLVMGVSLWSLAAPDGPAPNASQPSKPRRLMPAPEGFEKATTQAAPGLVVYYDPADKGAVDKALAVFRSGEGSPVMPAAIARRLTDNDGKVAADLKAMVKTDLDWNDEKAVGDYVNSLADQLNKLEAQQIHFYYLLTSQDRFKELVKDKRWGGEQFSYNKVRDAVDANFNAAMPEDGAADETVIPALYNEKAIEDVKAATLVEIIRRFETQRLQTVINTTQMRLMSAIAAGIRQNVIKPLDLKVSQQWLGYGVEGFYTAKYMSQVVGVAMETYLQQYIQPTTETVVSDDLNLLEPQDPANLKTELVGPYEGAMRARSTELTMWWIVAKGDKVVAQTLAAMKESKPADGKALLALIKEKTDADLEPDVARRPK